MRLLLELGPILTLIGLGWGLFKLNAARLKTRQKKQAQEALWEPKVRQLPSGNVMVQLERFGEDPMPIASVRKNDEDAPAKLMEAEYEADVWANELNDLRRKSERH